MADTSHPSCNHDEVLTPELDAAVARAAMAEGDLSHAAHHVAGALASDPSRADWIDLLDALARAAGGKEAAMALFPLDGSVWFGTAAVRAKLLGETDPDEAFSLLCQIIKAKPDVPYLFWADLWLQRLDPEKAVASLGAVLSLGSAAGAATNLAHAGEIARVLVARAKDPALLGVISAILTRRASEIADPESRAALLERAISWARETYERYPAWNTAVTLGTTLRTAQRWKEAITAWEDAVRINPNDLSARLDWADTLLESGDLPAARAKYLEVMDQQPKHPWAVPSVLYIDWLTSGGSDGRLVLSRYADTQPENQRARDLASRATPWVGYLPPPREASLSALEQLQKNPRAAAGTVALTLSHLESPSSQLVIRRFLRAHGGDLDLRVAQVPQPDMRVPKQHQRFPLWRWSGTNAQPAMPIPTDSALIRLVSTMAETPYYADAWVVLAARLTEEAGIQPTFESVEQLLRNALHPPPVAANIPPALWTYRSVLSVAMLLAAFPGWEGTIHRDALLSMAAVRNDWLAEAAMVALTERTRREPALRGEVQPLMLSILRDGPTEGYWCLGWVATASLFRLGQEEEDLRHALAVHLRNFEPLRGTSGSSDA